MTITYIGSAPPPAGRAQLVKMVDDVLKVVAEGTPECIEALVRSGASFDIVNFSDGRPPQFRLKDGSVVGWAEFNRRLDPTKESK